MTLRVGIAGYGLAGRLIHAPLLRGCGFNVVAIQTTNQERKTQVQQDLSDASICSTVEEMFALQLDLLVVASANIVHAEQAFAAIAAGVPVVIDKPMGRTYAETASIIQAGATASVPVCCFFNRRWDSDALTIKRVLKSGTLGTIHRMESRFERFRPEINPLSWRENMSAVDGGGQLLDLQPHLISSALDFFGKGQLVSSSVRSLRGAADDDSVLVLQHESGVMSYLSASAVVGSPGPRVRILGSKGALVINDLDPQELLLRAGKIPHDGAWDVPTASPAFIHCGDVVEEIPAENGNYALFYKEVEGAIKGLNPWPVDNEDTLMVAKIIDQARASSVHG
ncbi:MAG: dehydrogenase [Streptomycetaceae bacterium]|jgi:scyllo-inositol 2-dehydrogenase (NADP+)|nr:MAG: dehydrogenase [Streptomycetaceae bacterium]